jgi:hypothetical protein
VIIKIILMFVQIVKYNPILELFIFDYKLEILGVIHVMYW